MYSLSFSQTAAAVTQPIRIGWAGSVVGAEDSKCKQNQWGGRSLSLPGPAESPTGCATACRAHALSSSCVSFRWEELGEITSKVTQDVSRSWLDEKDKQTRYKALYSWSDALLSVGHLLTL